MNFRPISHKIIYSANAISSIIIILLTQIQLEISCNYSEQYLKMEWKYIILNYMTLIAVLGLFTIILRKLWISQICFSISFFLVGIVNYYMIKLHSLPLTIFELKNFKTALDVINGYNIKIDNTVLLLIALEIPSIILAFIPKFVQKNYTLKQNIIFNALTLIYCSALLYIGYLSEYSIKPHQTIGWSWQESYQTYGYVACSIEMIQSSFHIIQMPENYSEAAVQNIEIEVPETFSERPDIILILNETFYDLNQIIDIKTDAPYFDNFYSLENSIRGYSVVPVRMTNASEYELLTSNSLQIMQGITPFNVLDMTNANSIVSLMNQLGYNSIGAHPRTGENYSRGRAYPAMGFQKIYFEEDFINREFYSDRWFETDDSLYQNLITWYENNSEDNPLFIYLLTIQNHADYEMNPPEVDSIHILGDYGEYTSRINEFLSCMKLSDTAFKDLTDYFLNVSKPVIICMVGDHSPYFADDIVSEKYTGYEKDLRLRSTPFIIWSNRDMESKDVGYVSLNYIMPMVLEVAGLQRSPYYQYMLDLQKDVPVLSSFNMYMDSDGNITDYKTHTELTEKIENYFYLEYNNLSPNRNQVLFDVYSPFAMHDNIN